MLVSFSLKNDHKFKLNSNFTFNFLIFSIPFPFYVNELIRIKLKLIRLKKPIANKSRNTVAEQLQKKEEKLIENSIRRSKIN